ncbi:MAG: DUF6614 family protein [bacterium]
MLGGSRRGCARSLRQARRRTRGALPPRRSADLRPARFESLHHAVTRHASRVDFALYRDFPDAHRERGGEKF